MAEGDVEVVLKEDEQDDKSKPNGADTGTVQTIESSVSDDIAAVQRKLEESERARVAAESRAAQFEQRARSAEGTAYGSQMAIIQGALDTIAANRETLGAQYEEALGAGDFRKARELNDRLIELKVQENDLNKGKQALETQGRTGQPAPQFNPLTATDNEKIEKYIEGLGPNADRAAAWLRAHPDYVLDDAKRARMIREHHKALGAGHEQGSDVYFSVIEQGLGLGAVQRPAPNGNGAHVETPDPTSQAAQPVRRRDEDVQPSPAAPSRGGGSRTVRLTPEQQEAAALSGMTHEEYARSMERERKAGNIGKPRVH